MQSAQTVDSARALVESLECELAALLRVWFPRCVDRRYGGFLCDFDYRWRQTGPQHKTLEFQARMSRLAALLAAAFPDVPLYREVAEHVFGYLRDVMWDSRYGGWYRMLDREGHPGEGASKHLHGSAYALSACSAYYELTSDAQALDLAKSAFGWLEKHGHDSKNGGYFTMFQRDGRPILRAEDSPLDSDRDVIGTPYGYKDANSISDLLDGLTNLYAVWRDEHVRERLAEVFTIVRDRVVVAPGSVHIHMHLDWTPVPDFARYVQAIHTANHLIEAAERLGCESDEHTRAVYKSIVDTVLRYGWDPKNGGFYLGGSTFGHTYLADTRIMLEQKVWWGQAEGLRVLLRMSRRFPNDEHDYFARFRELWAYVQRYLIDSRRGGWLLQGLDCDPKACEQPKASEWKDASHEASTLLECIQTLRSGLS